MNLNKLESKLDDALSKETTESLTNWLNNKRMKTIKDLKEGDILYWVNSNRDIKRYAFFCEYPFNSGSIKEKYYILLDKQIDEPVRMYYTQLEGILEQDLDSYEKAQLLQIKKKREDLDDLIDRHTARYKQQLTKPE